MSLNGQNAVKGYINSSNGRWRQPEATFASPPAAPQIGQTWLFTDAVSLGKCAGGGTALAQCRWDGTQFAATGSAGSGDLANMVDSSASYADPIWLTALAWSKITGAPAFLTGNQLIGVSSDCTGSGATSISLTCAKSNGVAFGSAAFQNTAAFQSALGFSPENPANKGQANGYAGLDNNGKLPSSQLTQLAITDTYVVASEVAQLAIYAHEGDVAIRSDQTRTYIQNGGSAGTMDDWTALQTPGGEVTSVNGHVGDVSLSYSDVGAQPTIAGAPATFPTTWPWGSLSNVPATFAPSAHAMLSTAHSDTTAAAPVRGDGLFAIGVAPTWQRLAHPTATGGYFKWNGADIIASTGAASGTGSCTNQAVTSVNADAVPTCGTITAAMTDSSIAHTGADINTSYQVTVTHLASALPTVQGGLGNTTGTAATATSVAGGAVGSILYQSAPATTAMLAGNAAATDQVVISHGAGAAAQAPTLSNAPALSAANMTGLPTASMSGPSRVRICEVHIWGDGAAGALQTTDSEIASCYNGYGANLTVTAVYCYADNGSTTTTVQPQVTGGSTTSVLNGAVTCGNATFAAGTLAGAPILTAGSTIDDDIVAAGTAKSVRVVVVLTL